MDALPYPSFVTASDDRILYANVGMDHLLGELVHPKDKFNPQYLLQLSDVRQPKRDTRSQLKTGEYLSKTVRLGTPPRQFVVRATRVTNDTGDEFFCCVLTPQEFVNQVDYSELLDTVSSLIVQHDLDGNVHYLNHRVYEELGYRAGTDAPPTHLHQLDRFFSAEEWSRRSLELLAGHTVRYSSEFRRSDGSSFPVEVTIVPDRFSTDNRFTLTAQDMTRQKGVENRLREALDQVRTLSLEYQRENRELRQSIVEQGSAREIVSADPEFQKLLRRVEQVAPTRSTVLITGETGTGKELVARRIHALSERADRPLIIVDCSALPSSLIESELFGSHRGALSGTEGGKPGRFEAAHQGTLFLDEIGELPLELQSQLLRVLQEGSFTPLGDTTPRHVDVRVIAATSLDLRAEVQAGNFRSDLYYRINVFPVHLPPLREREADLGPLLWHFIRKYNAQLGRQVNEIGPEVIDRLADYAFPGNVRELENLVERALISVRGPLLTSRDLHPESGETPSGGGTKAPVGPAEPQGLPTLEEHQRNYILRVLKLTGGRVSGPRGAAKLLDINPQTLYGRMRKLGIR